jgi:hypothetical protein
MCIYEEYAYMAYIAIWGYLVLIKGLFIVVGVFGRIPCIRVYAYRAYMVKCFVIPS